MWNTTVFLTEMLGMVVLMLAVITSITVTKKYKLQGLAALTFGAATCSLGLLLAVMVGQIQDGPGFINPGPTLLVGLAFNDTAHWNLMLPALAGQFTAVIAVAVAFVLARLALKSCLGKDSDYLFESFQSDTSFVKPGKTIIGEVIGTIIFFGAILTVSKGKIGGTQVLIALIVGIGLFVAIFATANLGSMLNPAVGFGLLLIKSMTNKKDGLFKFDFANWSLGAVSNLAMAAALGALGLAI